jgi:very-short-patch-repair endonuclease
MNAVANPPRHGEGDHLPKANGGGGLRPAQRPEVYAARQLRSEMSLPEVLLWQRLRGAKAGLKVRRQHAIGPYVVDFFCSPLRLVIEIDGKVHEQGSQPAHDAEKDAFLTENGFRVIRIAAADVLKDVDAVADRIGALAARPLHHQPAADGPPPRAGEDFL